MPQWQGNREALESSGVRAIEALTKGTSIAANEGQTPPSGPDVANRCFQQLAHSYDEDYGGFREAPKFPSPGKQLTKNWSIISTCFVSSVPASDYFEWETE